jgi:NAD(P)-dependent dehydrogenase (short-subunit alcohol dehydrogenase family)
VVEPFRDRVALITGAASGIGRTLAVRLAAAGARVAGLDLQAEALEALRRELDGKPFASAVADVTDLAAVRAAAADLEGKLGPTDLLIACAGIGRQTSAATFDAAEVNSLINVNLIGVVNSVDAVLAGMRQRRRGHLAVLSSLASYRGLPHMAGYCASKAGVNALFDSLRIELGPFGIAVTTVCPGWIRTPMTARLNLPAREVMSVETAAGIILDALARRRPFLAFPSHAAWQLRLLRHAPRPISDWLTRRHLRRAERLLAGAAGGAEGRS